MCVQLSPKKLRIYVQRNLWQVEIKAQRHSSHEETEQQHEVEQNGGVGSPKHPLLCLTAPQDSELETFEDRGTWTLLVRWTNTLDGQQCLKK